MIDNKLKKVYISGINDYNDITYKDCLIDFYREIKPGTKEYILRYSHNTRLINKEKLKKDYKKLLTISLNEKWNIVYFNLKIYLNDILYNDDTGIQIYNDDIFDNITEKLFVPRHIKGHITHSYFVLNIPEDKILKDNNITMKYKINISIRNFSVIENKLDHFNKKTLEFDISNEYVSSEDGIIAIKLV